MKIEDNKDGKDFQDIENEKEIKRKKENIKGER